MFNTDRLATLVAVERRVPFWPTARLKRIQVGRVRRTIAHAYAVVLNYRQVMDARGLRPDDFETAADLAKFPLLDVATVRHHPERFLSAHLDKQALLPLYSSGSPTQIRKPIYWDREATLRLLAYTERDRVVTRLVGKGLGQKQSHIGRARSPSFVLRALWDAQTLLTRRVADRHVPSVTLPRNEMAQRINANRPDVVFLPAGSYADQIFRFLAERGFSVPSSVRDYGGDARSPDRRDLIESFGCPVYSVYQAVETRRLGFECDRRYSFHLNVDICPVRTVGEVGCDVPARTIGEVIVSNLVNRVTVLLNSCLDDRGSLAAEPCPCWRSLPLLKRLEGRCSETLDLADGRVTSSLVLEGFFRDELRPTLQVQLIHPAPGDIRWPFVPFAGIDREALRRRLLERGRDVLGEGTRAEVEFIANIPLTPTGKLLRVVTPVKNDA